MTISERFTIPLADDVYLLHFCFFVSFLPIPLVAYASVHHTVHTLDNFIFVISSSSFV